MIFIISAITCIRLKNYILIFKDIIMPDWIESIISAWTGHHIFAEWLVNEIKPKTIVELGVDYGYSAFVLSNALKRNNIDGKLYGVDLFQGDAHTGFRNTYDFVMEYKTKYNVDTLEIITSEFTELSNKWDLPIQLLHIDGFHTYEAVKNDFNCWSKHVVEDGIIIFHDVTSFPDDVGKFFNEIEGGYKLYFTHSAGLGVYTKNKDLYNSIITNFPNIIVN